MPISFAVIKTGAFPEGWQGGPDDMLEYACTNGLLQVQSQGDVPVIVGKVGGSAPSVDEGPWLNTGATGGPAWWFWDGTAGIYLPAQDQTKIGAIIMWSKATAPTSDYLLCDGEEYDGGDYPVLYALIGTTFGGSGGSFNVPDLRGRFPLCLGEGAGLTARTLNQSGGEEGHLLSVSEMPNHTHGLDTTNDSGAGKSMIRRSQNTSSKKRRYTLSSGGAATVAADIDITIVGGVVTSAAPSGPDAGGSGYTVIPTVTVVDPNGLGSGAILTAVLLDGVIDSVTVTNGGADYSDDSYAVVAGSVMSHNNMPPWRALNFVIRAK